MLFFYGTYLIGKMEMCDGVYIATRFVHIWWLPLIPIKTVLVLEPNRAVPIAFRWKSALFGWLRVWGLIATPAVVFGFGVSLLAIFGSLDDTSAMLGYLAATFVTGLALLLVGGGTIAAWVLGKLSPEEVAKRRVYREALGFPADPAAFVSGLPELRQTLYARVFEAVARLSAQGYRGITDPQREWPRLAEDPTVNDREALAAVLTLSRVERAFVPSMQHAALDQLNERAWSRMRALGFC